MMGWNSWNWIGVSGCDDGCKLAGMNGRCHSEVVMRQMADALARSTPTSPSLKSLGYDLINLSEGWPAECFRQGKCGSGRFANGTIMHDPVRYPSGIEALADYVHSLGLRFGACDAREHTTIARYILLSWAFAAVKLTAAHVCNLYVRRLCVPQATARRRQWLWTCGAVFVVQLWLRWLRWWWWLWLWW